jgi:glycosyltransferase involved in cell wall biosynthesis
MPYNIRIVSTYPPRRCGIGTFARELANALEHFTGEVGHIRVAAIDSDSGPYNIPVDLVIEQYHPQSWQYATKDIIARANESTNPTVVLLQHEYGLDPDDRGNDGEGTNFVRMAKAFKQNGLTIITYLHTVLDEPNEHQKMMLQQLSVYSDSLIVTTESAVGILHSKVYGIDYSKVKHIDHGIRMQHPSQYDRLAIKEQFGLKGHFLATTIGLLSPNKGIEYAIRAYGKFLKESCTDEQRQKITYLIAGEYHPDFLKAEQGRLCREHRTTIEQSLKDAQLNWCRTEKLEGVDFDKNDVVLLETFVDEYVLMKLYGATNVMILPYLNMHQISSGILADTLGSGRVAISTKFRYALELLHSNKLCRPGVVIGRRARGILVDAGEASVEQIAAALDYLLFNQNKRLRMEKEAHQRGYQMQWNNSAWALLQHVEFVREENQIVTGRGVRFTRRKKPTLPKINGLETYPQ